MHPVLFKIGHFAVPSYGFMILIGVLFAFLIGRRLARKEGINVTDMNDLTLYTLLVALLGARLLLVITELDQFIKHPRQLLSMLTSAGNFFGGLIAGAIFALLFIRRKKMPLFTVLDIAAPAVAIGHFFGRLGCLLAGCCWGQPAGSCPIGIAFHSHEAQTGIPLDIRLIPTQAMEALFNLLLGGFLLWFYRRKGFSGQLFSIYLMAYGSYRFLSEYVRGDTGRGYLFGDMSHPLSSLSIPQIMSLAAVLIGIGIYRYGRKKTV